MRQTFLDPVEWQISVVRTAFFETLRTPVSKHINIVKHKPDNAMPAAVSATSTEMLVVAMLPRPSVLAEIIQGSSDATSSLPENVGGSGRGDDAARATPEANAQSSSLVPSLALALGGRPLETNSREACERSRGWDRKKQRVAGARRDRDFDFREVFMVYEDRDLVACPPLRQVRETDTRHHNSTL